MPRSFGMAAALALGLIPASPASGQLDPVTFTQRVDTGTSIPGGSGDFFLLEPPALSNGNVAFRGFDSDFREGIYALLDGVLQLVADANTPIPDGFGNFARFTAPSIDGAELAFKGRDSMGRQGIYRTAGALLLRVADQDTAVPGGGIGSFSSFGNSPSLEGDRVAFRGFAGGVEEGIYTDVGGSLHSVAEKGDTVPGTVETLLGFGDPSLDAGAVAFFASHTAGKGVYTDLGGSLSTVLDLTTEVPGSQELFSDLDPLPAADGARVGSLGFFPSGQGIFIGSGGVLMTLADTDTEIPEGDGTFAAFGTPTLDAGEVAFRGTGTGQIGIYATVGGDLRRVVGSGDLLAGGRVVTELTLGREALSGNQLVFLVSFADGSQALLVATLHPPCGDTSEDGQVDGDDVRALREALAEFQSLSAEGLGKCSVIGGALDCDVLDWVVLQRALAEPPLPPGIDPVCEATL